MTKIGLPVPFGFTITTEACNKYYEDGRKITQEVVDAIYEKLDELEQVTGKTFGSTENPLLVSVRSGAAISMPGMMDTILNLGLIDKETAVTRLEPQQIDQLLHPLVEAGELKKVKNVAKGLFASPGVASGHIYFTAEEAAEATGKGEKVLLVRAETSSEDLAGMVAAEGILTARGGMTSHATVVARGMGKCCVAGCSEAKVDEENKILAFDSGVSYKKGDLISIDGSTSAVYDGAVKTVEPDVSGDFATIMGWSDEIRTLKVRTNADNPRDAKQAVEFGCEGIGLCRIEHMFFDEERIPAIRRMIVADTDFTRP